MILGTSTRSIIVYDTFHDLDLQTDANTCGFNFIIGDIDVIHPRSRVMFIPYIVQVHYNK